MATLNKRCLPGKGKSDIFWLDSVAFLSWFGGKNECSADGRKYGGREGKGKVKEGKGILDGGDDISLSKINIYYKYKQAYILLLEFRREVLERYGWRNPAQCWISSHYNVIYRIDKKKLLSLDPF